MGILCQYQPMDWCSGCSLCIKLDYLTMLNLKGILGDIIPVADNKFVPLGKVAKITLAVARQN